MPSIRYFLPQDRSLATYKPHPTEVLSPHSMTPPPLRVCLPHPLKSPSPYEVSKERDLNNEIPLCPPFPKGEDIKKRGLKPLLDTTLTSVNSLRGEGVDAVYVPKGLWWGKVL